MDKQFFFPHNMSRLNPDANIMVWRGEKASHHQERMRDSNMAAPTCAGAVQPYTHPSVKLQAIDSTSESRLMVTQMWFLIKIVDWFISMTIKWYHTFSLSWLGFIFIFSSSPPDYLHLNVDCGSVYGVSGLSSLSLHMTPSIWSLVQPLSHTDSFSHLELLLIM